MLLQRRSLTNEPKANVERYDALRKTPEVRHAVNRRPTSTPVETKHNKLICHENVAEEPGHDRRRS